MRWDKNIKCNSEGVIFIKFGGFGRSEVAGSEIENLFKKFPNIMLALFNDTFFVFS